MPGTLLPKKVQIPRELLSPIPRAFNTGKNLSYEFCVNVQENKSENLRITQECSQNLGERMPMEVPESFGEKVGTPPNNWC